MKGKDIIKGIATSLLLAGIARAGGLYMQCPKSLTNPRTGTSDIYVTHITGASEGFDGSDSLFLEAPKPRIDFYSKTTYPYPQNRLETDSRPPESMTTINTEIYGRGLSSAVNAQLFPSFWNPNGENNFALKRIRADLYDASDNLLASYDLKNLAEKGETIPITVNEGLSYNMKIRFYDIEDLNFDRVVDFKDFAEFAEKWQTSGHNMYDNWAGGADFDKDGYVDAKDLEQFVEGWLLETQSVSGE